MSNIIYLDTNSDNLVMRVPGNERDGEIEVVKAPANIRFDLTNTVKAKAMQEARAVAKAHGLKIANAEHMAVTHSA